MSPSFFYNEAFIQTFPFAAIRYNDDVIFFEVLCTDAPSFLALIQRCEFDPRSSQILPSKYPPCPTPIKNLCPAITVKYKFVCMITDPSVILFRLPYLQNGTPPRLKHIMSRISPLPQPPQYFDYWETRTNRTLDMPLAILQRNSHFIPPRAREVLLKNHAHNLPLATRLHSEHIPLACESCKRRRQIDTSSLITDISLPSPHTEDNPCDEDVEADESLTHFLFYCPISLPITYSLKCTLQTHFSTSITHPADLLFPLPSLPADGFPFTMLLAIALQTLWIARCDKRIDHEKSILQKSPP